MVYDDVLYLDNGIEIIPVWKQCGCKKEDWSDDEKWLWDSGGFTQHMLYVNSESYYQNRAWWIWKDCERGYVYLEDNGTYTAHIHIGMTRSEQYGFKMLEEAAYTFIGKYKLNPNYRILFKTNDDRYYDLNMEEVYLNK